MSIHEKRAQEERVASLDAAAAALKANFRRIKIPLLSSKIENILLLKPIKA